MPSTIHPDTPAGFGLLVDTLHEFNVGLRDAANVKDFLRHFVASWGGLSPETEIIILNGIPKWASQLITSTNWLGLK